MTMPTGQQLTFLYTDDLKRSVAFYQHVLELEPVIDQGAAVLFRVNAGAYLGVCDRPDRPRGTDGVMVSFVEDDVDATYAKLSARGVVFDGPPGPQMDGRVYAAFFRDPDGYRLEIQAFRDPAWDALFAEDGKRIYSGAPFEAAAGYARAVVDGDHVHVSGTTGFDPASMTFPEGVEAQAEQCFRNVEAALTQAGCTLADLIRVRVFTATREEFQRIKPIIKRHCDAARPANTSVLCELDSPAMRVEVEATARRR